MGVLGLHLGAAGGALDREVGRAGLDLVPRRGRLRFGLLGRRDLDGHDAIVTTRAMAANWFFAEEAGEHGDAEAGLFEDAMGNY